MALQQRLALEFQSQSPKVRQAEDVLRRAEFTLIAHRWKT